MSTHSPRVCRTFRISIDIETTIDLESGGLASPQASVSRYQQAFVQGLRAHPEILRQLLRAYAVDALNEARKLLEAEYGWGRASEQQLLQPLIAELSPAAQAYFTEELEEGASAYYFECHKTTVKGFRMSELDAEMEQDHA
jgi:hypothetical protein